MPQMGIKKAEKNVEVQAQTATTEQEETFYADVVEVCNRAGSGGDVTICKVRLLHNNKTIFRSVQGPVKEGHILALRECVRESRRSR